MMDKIVSKLIENAALYWKNKIRVYGIYGCKDGVLVEPSTPDSNVVVMFYDDTVNHAYDIDNDKVFKVDDGFILIEPRGELVLVEDYPEEWKKQIDEFLDSGDFPVSREGTRFETGSFTKMAFPLIRSIMPKIFY